MIKISEIKCWLGIHKYKDIKTQITKNICFGTSGCELPGYRVTRKCERCGKIEYQSLNLNMSNKYLYQEFIWK